MARQGLGARQVATQVQTVELLGLVHSPKWAGVTCVVSSGGRGKETRRRNVLEITDMRNLLCIEHVASLDL